MNEPITVYGKDLHVGDTIRVWWTPNLDTITALVQYYGTIESLKNARIATFSHTRAEMTIQNDLEFTVVSRGWRRPEHMGLTQRVLATYLVEPAGPFATVFLGPLAVHVAPCFHAAHAFCGAWNDENLPLRECLNASDEALIECGQCNPDPNAPLQLTVYSQANEHVASVRFAEDAALLVQGRGDGTTIRHGHRKVLWNEGKESQPAAESYDHVADVCEERMS